MCQDSRELFILSHENNALTDELSFFARERRDLDRSVGIFRVCHFLCYLIGLTVNNDLVFVPFGDHCSVEGRHIDAMCLQRS